ncbi:MAG: 50S ribosomal protein L25 [Acidimicrobiales bacterium]|nr:50S ribosomal protein L25 [Acidimicrobiales bacterium]
MAEITLKATTGRELGSGPSKRLRADGKVPAVVYGLDADPIPVTVEWRPLREALTTEAGLNALIDLDVDGTVALTIVKELQRHPIRGNVLHIDFLRVSADAEITVDVPVVLEGEAKAVESENGVIDQVLATLSINAKPADIPNEISVDVSDLVIGDAIRVGDLKLPAGVTTDLDPEDPVVTAAFGETLEVAESDEAEGEAAEGGEAAGDAAGAEAEGGDEG